MKTNTNPFLFNRCGSFDGYPYFYYLLKYFKEYLNINNLKVFYTEPESYLFSSGLFNSFKSSYGPLKIMEIPGFSGFEERESRRILIILLGFDGELSKEINEDISPIETFIVNGFPSYIQKYKDISLIANDRLVTDHNIIIKYARASNPYDTYNLLLNILNSFNNQKPFINIAPLGTKPMALGACLFALHNPNIRVVYPLPDKYTDKISSRHWCSWRYSIQLKM